MNNNTYGDIWKRKFAEYGINRWQEVGGGGARPSNERKVTFQNRSHCLVVF